MRIPIFEQITLQLPELENLETLQDALAQAHPGQVPCYIGLWQTPPSRHEELARNIVEAMKRLGVGPLFPYPLYLVSEHLKDFDALPVVRTVETLPQHFFKKVKRLKNKELALLHKAVPQAQKLLNLDCNTKLARLQGLLRSNRALYDLSRELHFYEKLLERIEAQEKRPRE
jgi:hypothetical protein